LYDEGLSCISVVKKPREFANQSPELGDQDPRTAPQNVTQAGFFKIIDSHARPRLCSRAVQMVTETPCSGLVTSLVVPLSRRKLVSSHVARMAQEGK
jgi:hypothetical protein